MTEEDLDEVLEIEKISFPLPWSRPLFEKELQNAHAFNLVLRDLKKGGRGVAGYVVFWHVADEMHLLQLAVHEDYRRRGLGRLLLAEAIRLAGEKGCLHAFLEVRQVNEAGKALYLNFGFKEIGLRKKYYSDGEDACVMGRPLPLLKTKGKRII